MQFKKCNHCQETLAVTRFSFGADKGKRRGTCRSCRGADKRTALRRYPRMVELRNKIISTLGGVCACCGISERGFLTIDHVNNDGAAHRKSLGRSGGNGGPVLRDIRRQGYPRDKYQILCWNCNHAKAIFGICPHKKGLPIR